MWHTPSMSGLLPKRLSSWLFRFWILGVATVSLAPLRVKLFLHTIGPLHNAGHLVVFSVSGSLLLLTKSRKVIIAGYPLLFVFAGATEFLQSAFYGERFEWNDLGLDSLALFVSPFIVFILNALMVFGRIARVTPSAPAGTAGIDPECKFQTEKH